MEELNEYLGARSISRGAEIAFFFLFQIVFLLLQSEGSILLCVAMCYAVAGTDGAYGATRAGREDHVVLYAQVPYHAHVSATLPDPYSMLYGRLYPASSLVRQLYWRLWPALFVLRRVVRVGLMRRRSLGTYPSSYARKYCSSCSRCKPLRRSVSTTLNPARVGPGCENDALPCDTNALIYATDALICACDQDVILMLLRLCLYVLLVCGTDAVVRRTEPLERWY
eukprot:1528687-Rhodomonas_salina.1